jgi:hypothetical protein
VQTYPLPLQVAAGKQVLHRTVIDEREFVLRVWLGDNGDPDPSLEVPEIKLSSEKSFIPHLIDTKGDTRTLSYRIKKLALIDARGCERVIYASRIHWLFVTALPVISLVKCIRVNRRLHLKELWQTARNLWGTELPSLGL